MAGNSQRKGAIQRKAKKGATGGSGGKRGAQTLKPRGKTLPAEERPWHKGYSGTEQVPSKTAWKQHKEKKAAAVEGRAPKVGQPGSVQTTRGGKVAPGTRIRQASGPARPAGPRVAPGRRANTPREAPELLVGRNPVVEALRAHVPSTALYIAQGIDIDERITEIVRSAADKGLAILEVTRRELDRMTGGVLHQGVGLAVPPYNYEALEDLLGAARDAVTAPLLVALDGVTDPRNLGAIVRSAAAFGAQGVIVPERRAAGMTATAWRTSAGAAARLPIAQVTNLTRTLKACQEAGYMVVGLDADGDVSLHDLEAAVDPIVIVIGSEGRGLSRLVGESCDLLVNIPMAGQVESLNASVAAAVTLSEIARRRALDI
ncbi:23S rRNA (guanosine(2251)-2'-O)-methyltransferase RlmB [Longispora sp. NPDC051575]|uniref:23S rRNA (guanosine(2251)-2'-O)-methyltransferase RlmB n=1 Tax=Longispora sp. NPDC051575 TaxID=3154943 RepID=UPI003430CF5C